MSSAVTSAWILAGGAALRYGSDKALARIGDETLLARTARVCREAGLEVTVVARHEREGGLPTLLEADRADRHPLHGVAAALAAAAARGEASALCVPCDLPDLPASTVRRLREAPAPAHAAGQRLLCHLPVGLAASAAAFAADGAPVRAFLEAAGAVSVEVPTLSNLNRPGDAQYSK